MSGQIFISYRRDDASHLTGRLSDRLAAHFPKNPIFVDVDMEPGIDFVEAIEQSVGFCDVLIAVIGNRWLISSEAEGRNGKRPGESRGLARDRPIRWWESVGMTRRNFASG